MATTLRHMILGIFLGIFLFAGNGLAAEPAEVGKFVNARIAISEMMLNYFSGGRQYGEGQRPSPEAMREMGADINSKLSTLDANKNLISQPQRLSASKQA